MARYTRPVDGRNTIYANAGPYTSQQWADIMAIREVGDEVTTRGVYGAYLNRLNVVISSPNVLIATGAGLVNGHILINDGAVTLTPPAPAANPRIDVVCLIYNSTAAPVATQSPTGYTFLVAGGGATIPARTCEIAIMKGAEAVGPAAPALEQDAARLYMIPLLQYEISVAGAFSSVTERREFIGIRDEVAVINSNNTTLETGHIMAVGVDGGFGADNLGVALESVVEDDAGTLITAGKIGTRYTDATLATMIAREELWLASANAAMNLSGVITAPAAASVTDGNARGSGSVDFQGLRTLATQVASGNYSVIGGGERNSSTAIYATVGGGLRNEASGNYSTVASGSFNTASASSAAVCGGESNTASNTFAFIGGGYGNAASGIVSSVVGGDTNTASGQYSAVGGGYTNAASGNYSAVCSGLDNTASGGKCVVLCGEDNVAGNDYSAVSGYEASTLAYGEVVSASGYFAARGDACGTIQCVARAQETHGDATWRTLYLDGAGASRVLTLANSSAWNFSIRIVGITQLAASQWAYNIVGIIERDNAGTTTLAASTVTTLFESDANFAAQVVASASGLSIQVSDSGSSGSVVRWVATIEMARVVFP